MPRAATGKELKEADAAPAALVFGRGCNWERIERNTSSATLAALISKVAATGKELKVIDRRSGNRTCWLPILAATGKELKELLPRLHVNDPCHAAGSN